MTKRFTYKYNIDEGILFDDKYKTFYHIRDSEMNIQLLCERLNKIVDKNNKLESVLCPCVHHSNFIDVLNKSQEVYINSLKEENEKLKYTLGTYMLDLNNYKDKCRILEEEQEKNLNFLIRASKRLGFESLDHLLYTLDKGEITGYSTANWKKE